MSEMSSLFLNEKPVRALIIVSHFENGANCTEISEGIDATYSHTVGIVQELDRLGLVSTERKGRTKVVKVTESGRRQAELYAELMEIYGESKDLGRQRLKDRELNEEK